MNKSDLVTRVAEKSALTKVKASKGIEALIGIITNVMKKKGKVTLVGFGTFKAVKRKARSARNPKTGATIKIPGRRVPRFVAGSELKKKVLGKWIPPHKD